MKNSKFKTEKLPFLELMYVEDTGHSSKRHLHNELSLTAMKDSLTCVKYDTHYDINEINKISIQNPNIAHSCSSFNTQGLTTYSMYIDKTWCAKLQKSIDIEAKEYIPINTTLIDSKCYYDDFIILCEELFLDETSLLEKEEKCTNFIYEIFLNYCDFKNIADMKNNQRAKIIAKYIDENIDQNLSLTNIAKYIDLSIIHTIRIFKNEFGMPIHSYILNKKIHLAKNLLLQDIPIAQIAQLSGFFDQSHLNKSFKQVFRLTPKQYQNSITR
jgi:AraC-like DNA-binding protein